ncbi:MAG: fused DSP-PTPase phosphatase/NAD kinase-like protein, partial [Candidatus Methylomirabilaceae bacterium]
LDHETVRTFGLRYLHLPVPDYGAPTIQQIDEFLAFVETAEGDGAVVVHCFAGQGRTGTMLACALVDRGMSAEQAIRIVRTRRWPSIDTPVQEQAIEEFAAVRERRDPAPEIHDG